MGDGLTRSIQLNDAAAWESLSAGHYAVFLSNANSDVLIDGSGAIASGDTSVAVFDSIEAAEAFAKETVADSREICAAIYDHHGRSGDPLRRVYHEDIQHRFDLQRRARRDSWAGGCLLGAFVIWSVVAAKLSDMHFLWFYIIGMKLLVLGTILFVRGIGYFLGQKGK